MWRSTGVPPWAPRWPAPSGVSETPDSSWKTSHAPRRRAPSLSAARPPSPSGRPPPRCVPGRAGGALPGPAQLSEQPPDMARVVAHPGGLLDDLRHPAQRPQLGGVSVLARAAAKLGVQLGPLLIGEERRPARPAPASPAAPCSCQTNQRDTLCRDTSNRRATSVWRIPLANYFAASRRRCSKATKSRRGAHLLRRRLPRCLRHGIRSQGITVHRCHSKTRTSLYLGHRHRTAPRPVPHPGSRPATAHRPRPAHGHDLPTVARRQSGIRSRRRPTSSTHPDLPHKT